MLRLLKDPLVHFLLIGAALFGVSAWRGEMIRAGRERITITAEQVSKAGNTAALTQGRALSQAELNDLVESMVREEVLYREALALGLDKNDDEVRRRLVEKMNYLTQDLADPASSPDELRAFYTASPQLFTIPPLVSFDQVFFSPNERGAKLEADAAAGLAQLHAGKPPDQVGDHTPLRATYEDAPRDQIRVLFGEPMADALFTAPSGDWAGPYRSDFGLHLVRLRSRTEARLPLYEEIAARVAEELGAKRRREANEAAYRRLRANYNVSIETPAAEQ
jgi:outer membrane protein assembly factor BamE (lipoprotein component of BamABCDE complex)